MKKIFGLRRGAWVPVLEAGKTWDQWEDVGSSWGQILSKEAAQDGDKDIVVLIWNTDATTITQYFKSDDFNLDTQEIANGDYILKLKLSPEEIEANRTGRGKFRGKNRAQVMAEKAAAANAAPSEAKPRVNVLTSSLTLGASSVPENAVELEGDANHPEEVVLE